VNKAPKIEQTRQSRYPGVPVHPFYKVVDPGVSLLVVPGRVYLTVGTVTVTLAVVSPTEAEVDEWDAPTLDYGAAGLSDGVPAHI
jgi:hypothetical protein